MPITKLECDTKAVACQYMADVAHNLIDKQFQTEMVKHWQRISRENQAILSLLTILDGMELTAHPPVRTRRVYLRAAKP